MVSSTWNYAQLDALHANRWHLVGWMHYGRTFNRTYIIPRNWPYAIVTSFLWKIWTKWSINPFIDIQQLNLIMDVLGTPPEDFMSKISSESVSWILSRIFNGIFFGIFCKKWVKNWKKINLICYRREITSNPFQSQRKKISVACSVEPIHLP